MITVNDIINKKNKEKITMLTAYDYQTAKIADESGVDVVLVGDSLGMVVLGYETTLKVSVDDMIYHSKAVKRGLRNSFLLVDMPYLSYNVDIRDSIYNAGKIISEGNAQGVKIEGGKRTLETVKRIVDMEIPVAGHLGLTPQSVHKMGGFKMQGKSKSDAEIIIEDAIALEKAGAFCIILEGIPENLAKIVSESVNIPTIGIGAGRYTDGQVLVIYDMLGFNDKVPKFVKKYINGKELLEEAIKKYVSEVKNGQFPNDENIYSVLAEI